MIYLFNFDNIILNKDFYGLSFVLGKDGQAKQLSRRWYNKLFYFKTDASFNPTDECVPYGLVSTLGKIYSLFIKIYCMINGIYYPKDRSLICSKKDKDYDQKIINFANSLFDEKEEDEQMCIIYIDTDIELLKKLNNKKQKNTDDKKFYAIHFDMFMSGELFIE